MVQATVILVSLVTSWPLPPGKHHFLLGTHVKELTLIVLNTLLQSPSSLGEPLFYRRGTQLGSCVQYEKMDRWSPNERQTSLMDLVLNSDHFSDVLFASAEKEWCFKNTKYSHFIISRYLNRTVTTNAQLRVAGSTYAAPQGQWWQVKKQENKK